MDNKITRETWAICTFTIFSTVLSGMGTIIYQELVFYLKDNVLINCEWYDAIYSAFLESNVIYVIWLILFAIIFKILWRNYYE